MLIRKGYKFRLKLKAGEDVKMRQFAGCCRFVWNKALALQDRLLKEENEKLLSRTELLNLLPAWKQEHPFLADVHSQILQQTLIDLDRAFEAFFRRIRNSENPGHPRFKKKWVHDAFRYPQGFKIEGRKIFLPKLGWFRFYKSRQIEGTPKNVTVSRDGSQWDISIQVEQEITDPIPLQEPSVGLDMGISRFYTCSDGSFADPLNAFKTLALRLAGEQRKLSCKVKFSANWRKQKAKVGKVHRKIRNARMDFLHRESTTLAKSFAVVYAEDLVVKNMTRSAKGTTEEPGRNVRAKSTLNKYILDQGWGEFMRQLDYKLSWKGGRLIKVPPQHTSQTCSMCGHVSKSNRRSQSRFVCELCGLKMNADRNAAINIHTLGQRGFNACGDERLLSSVKQELPGNGDRVPVLAAT